MSTRVLDKWGENPSVVRSLIRELSAQEIEEIRHKKDLELIAWYHDDEDIVDSVLKRINHFDLRNLPFLEGSNLIGNGRIKRIVQDYVSKVKPERLVEMGLNTENQEILEWIVFFLEDETQLLRMLQVDPYLHKFIIISILRKIKDPTRMIKAFEYGLSWEINTQVAITNGFARQNNIVSILLQRQGNEELTQRIIRGLNDDTLLATIAFSDKLKIGREDAIDMIQDQSLLGKLILTARDEGIKEYAIRKLKNIEVLKDVVTSQNSPKLKKLAFWILRKQKDFKDVEFLKAITLSHAGSDVGRDASYELFKLKVKLDQDYLDKLLKSGLHGGYKMYFIPQIKDPAYLTTLVADKLKTDRRLSGFELDVIRHIKRWKDLQELLLLSRLMGDKTAEGKLRTVMDEKNKERAIYSKRYKQTSEE